MVRLTVSQYVKTAITRYDTVRCDVRSRLTVIEIVVADSVQDEGGDWI